MGDQLPEWTRGQLGRSLVLMTLRFFENFASKKGKFSSCSKEFSPEWDLLVGRVLTSEKSWFSLICGCRVWVSCVSCGVWVCVVCVWYK